MLRIRPTSQQPCAKLVETSKCNTFAMIYKFLKLTLLLSVTSASVSNLARFQPHIHQMFGSAPAYVSPKASKVGQN